MRGGSMNARFFGTLGGSAALLLGGSLVVAQPSGPGREGPPDAPPGGPPLGRAARVLELTEQQQEAARQMFEQGRPQMEALHKEMCENRAQLEEALESGQADPTAVGELVIAGHSLRKEEQRLREDSKAAFESLLTPEQRLKLQALEAVREDMGPRGPRPGPGAPPGAWGPPGPPPEPPEEE